MNQLLSIRTNILYSKKVKEDKTKPDEFTKYNELIFLVDKPSYNYSNEGEIVRERTIEEVRFVVSEKNFQVLIDNLEKLKNVTEEELQ